MPKKALDQMSCLAKKGPSQIETSKQLKNQEKPSIEDSDNEIFDNKNRSKIDDSSWLDSKEAARFLSISTKSLLNLTSNGKIPYAKLGRRNRYLKADLHKLLLLNRKGPVYGN